MVEAALYVLTGSILYAGAHHLYLGTTRTSPQTHIPLAAMYLLLAGFVLTSALMLQSQDASAQLQLARFSMTLGILMWLALIWYVAYYTRTRRFLLLDLLTAAWIIFLIRNTSLPHGLLYADIAPTELASVGRWWIAVHRAEVPLPVHKRVPQVEVLRHADERGVNDRLAVRVVVTAGIAGDLRALAML